MKNVIKIIATKEGRTLSGINRKRLGDLLEGLKDGDVELTIKRRGKRSSQANRYYFGIVLDTIRMELLNRGTITTVEDLHEWAKGMFNKDYVRGEDGEVVMEIPKTTTDMNKEQFGFYIERIVEWAAQNLEVTIPAPGEQTELFSESKAA